MDLINHTQKYPDPLVYVGTYTDRDGEGIYICRFDVKSGNLRQIAVTREIENPSYLVINAKKHLLYAVSEVSVFDGRPGGGVIAYRIHPVTGRLTRINHQPSHGGAPCYLTLTNDGRYLFAVNYLGGNIIVYRIREDGGLGEASDIKFHSGKGLNPARQDGPHPHSIVLDAANEFVFVPDLGLDKIVHYKFEKDNGRLLANQPRWTESEPGSGPRHMIFHPLGRFAYVINELNSTIASYRYHRSDGTLELLQAVSTVPDGYTGRNIAADIHLSPDGSLLLGSNRGHDSIAVYIVDQTTGWLTHTGIFPSHGKTPRGFVIDPSGRFVLVANQDSDGIVIYGIEQNSGLLKPTRMKFDLPSPVFLELFYPAEA